MNQPHSNSPSKWTHSPLVALGVLCTTLWTLLSLVELQRYLHDSRIPWWHVAILLAPSTLAVVLWLALDLRSTRYVRQALDPPRIWFSYQLRRLPALAIGYFAVVTGLRVAITSALGIEYQHLPWPAHIFYEFVKVSLFYCLWLGLVFGTLGLLQWREQSARLVAVQKVLADAQLERLQAQLRPHFLFNTLNTVSSLMHADVARADRVLARLGELLRASLAAGRHDTTSLREELRLLRLYAEIMVERFGGRLELVWDIPDGTLELEIPALLMQPLIENAFKHGIERTMGASCVEVIARVESNVLRLEIRNTGSNLSAGWQDGLGLANCRERLRVHYGSSASCLLFGEDDGSVVARVVLPARRAAL